MDDERIDWFISLGVVCLSVVVYFYLIVLGIYFYSLR